MEPHDQAGAAYNIYRLEPVMIDREQDLGVYVEPNVWMCHAIDAEGAAAPADA